MADSPSSRKVVARFGAFETNLQTGETWKRGIRIKLGPQPVAVLLSLLQTPGEIVTREDLQRKLWPQDTFVEFENGLNSAVKKLRTALGDAADQPLYIETVPRIGYRFIAPAEIIPPSEPLGRVSTVSGADDRPAESPVAQGGGRVARLVLSWTSIILIMAAGAYVGWSVLRFGRPGHMTAGALTKPGIRLASSQSSEAHDLYLKGMYFWNQRTTAGFEHAIVEFQHATKVDPADALAYAGLADSYTLLVAYSSLSGPYLPQARAAATRALELDPNLAEAHAAMALIVQNHDSDWQKSEKEFRRAIQLNPNYATAHQWYAEHLMWLGRFDAALQENRKAQQLDPLSTIIAADRGAILYFSRRYDNSIEELQRVLRRDPIFPRAEIIIFPYVEKRMFNQALSQVEHQGIYGQGPWHWAMLAYIYGRAGRLEDARHQFENLQKFSQREQVYPAQMLFAHLGVGDKEGALADLQQAYSEHSGLMVTLKVEPAFDPLRGDPRFQDLLHRVHLDQ